ncbi:translational activator [Aulographum hederae CBS 113979]|uniref:eIF-2-alpha kinase activator GCN1 n=1 Tax=Aulographum hederae CBS 113979 TaxID=1176131 RepID=A0A6G1GJQ9_9PEZI|nr:translational activator [Aulographum hederae CBS 113979]
MAEDQANGAAAPNREQLRASLFSSSTKSRISDLQDLHQRLVRNEIGPSDIQYTLKLFLDTYALYIDRPSRRAVQQCLESIASRPQAEELLPPFIKSLESDASKPTLAPSSAFVLVEWCSVLLQVFAKNSKLWEKWGLSLIIADNQALELCVDHDTRASVKHSALVVTRRALRTIFRSDDLGLEKDAIVGKIVTTLTAKGPSPTAKNAVFLGVVAGVCSRLDFARPLLDARKKDYFDFYVREIIGSRTLLPAHISEAFNDFFATFVTAQDLQSLIIPAVEKALLRAPEVVLNDLISPMIRSLPTSLDLASVLHGSLLKPLSSNIKSTNITIRNGAVSTFETVAARCYDEPTVSKIADELLNPLKQSKVTAADQRILQSQMLAALNGSPTLTQKIPAGLVGLALKEANEAAVEAEVRAISKHVQYGFEHKVKLEPAVLESFAKGIGDKRPAVRRQWALKVGDILWPMDREGLSDPSISTFVQGVLTRLLDGWMEVIANPIPSVQSGLVAVAYVFLALCSTKFINTEDSKVKTVIQKASIPKNILVADPKPSFLLNFRVYSKLSSQEDLSWGVRALAAVASPIAGQKAEDSIGDAWSQAFIYFIAAAELPPAIRREATATLSRSYADNPSRIGSIIVKGLWRWRRNVDMNEKDTAAQAAKSGNENLHIALRSICLSPEELSQLDAEVEQSTLSVQLTDLLILCRPELIPRASWIDTCLKVGADPGALVSGDLEACISKVMEATQIPLEDDVPKVHEAACNAAAELAFVAPDVAISRLVQLLTADLDPKQLAGIGPTEAAIFRTPEGTAFVDVLSQKGPAPVIANTKDRDTLRWEAELRAQLAQKKGQQAKKLTADEQAKVNAQLAKEAGVRKQVKSIVSNLSRGVGIVKALATGPPTDAELWIVPALDLLVGAIEGGAGLVLEDAAALAYLSCAERISSRLGTMRSFVGVATLRTMGVTQLPAELQEEPLDGLVTRVLYRLRFLSEQRPFDTASLAYILPLIFLVLEKGGTPASGSEESDEQIVLALEFLTFHTSACTNSALPRKKILATLVSAMQRFTQHYRTIKDCLQDLARGLAPNVTEEEIKILLLGAIVPQTSVRTSVLQAIDNELDLEDMEAPEEVWLACHDDVEENAELGRTIWEENTFTIEPRLAFQAIPYLDSTDRQLRRAAAKALAEALVNLPDLFHEVLAKLQSDYVEKAKPRVPERDQYGMPVKKDMTDPWEGRQGIALALKDLAPIFKSDDLVDFVQFLIGKGPLGDRSASVRDAMVDAATSIIAAQGRPKVEELMKLFEQALDAPNKSSEAYDSVNEAVVILYGSLARHLDAGDGRVPKVVQRLLATLSTPSESVQYAVAECLPPLVRASQQETSKYVQQLMDELLNAKKYAARRGAAYGLAGVISGRGLGALREFRIMSTLKGAAENKKDQVQRQGPFLAYELFSLILGRVFEPYVIQIVPQLISGFGDTSADVREACLDASKTCFSSLSSFGVKQILPTLLEGLEETQWRSKKGACDLLGAMAYLDPQQLALSLPDIIPPLTTVLTDSHKEVRGAANRSLQRFGEVISNPEIKGNVNILLKALSDPTKYTDDALDALIKVSFVHYLDAPSLALVVRILERGLGDRSATKRKSSQIIGSLAHLTERKDLIAHLPILVAGLKVAIVDPVPATRATASKALGSTIEKLGEDALPDLIPSLMNTLKSDTGAGDRLGSAQALSEVLAGLGTTRLEETLPSILQNATSSKPSVREGFMSLFIFLPACFGNSFANYLSRIIPTILSGLADDIESIRETSLRAGRLLVKNFATRAIDLLLPELERGLADDSHRIRLSSVELVGDLLFNLTGISSNTEQDEVEEGATEAGKSLLEVLGEEKRNKVLSALYICRCDTSGLVRTAAINVWKALVASPRTLRELIPTLTQLLIRRLASSNMEQKVIAGNALGELIRKAGEGVLATLLPTLEDGLHSTDTDAKQGICIALRELISAAAPETLEDHEKTLISVVRTALVDSDSDVREAAAEAFDSLQRILGKRAVDQVLPSLLSQLRDQDEAENALAALLTLLTDVTRSNIILPNLLPTLIASPISAFNARAIASLAEVASTAMTRRLPNILNALMDNIVSCKDEELVSELNQSFETVLLSVDEYDGLSTSMAVMLSLVKHDDHKKRRVADVHLAKFFAAAEIDISRYYPDLIRALLISFDDGDSNVVKAAWSALTELTKRMRKEEMESLVISTRQVLGQVGVAGHNLPGFSLPKGINAILPIFLQGLMNGTAEQKTQAALGISDIIDRTSPDGLKPFVTQITGPLIRVVSERSVDVKAAILYTLNNLLEKIPTFLKPFLPQLQRTFAKSLADTSSEILRTRAAKALGTLITMTPRIDPLIAELVTGSKTSDAGVRTAMLKALYEVVSKAGHNMNETSRTSILGLMDTETDGGDSMTMTNARLLGALIKVLPADTASGLIKSRVLCKPITKASILALNAVLLESSESLTEHLQDETIATICHGMNDNLPFIAQNSALAAGKYLLSPSSNKAWELTKTLFESIAQAIAPGRPVDVRRLALVVTRTVSREHNDIVRPHLGFLTPPIFASVRDPVIPVKLAAEAAFLSVFSVVDDEGAVFEKFLAGPGAGMQPGQKRIMQDYFKRVAMRLGAQARERKEAEGGQGGLGLSSDEVDDEKEVWSVGQVDLGEGGLGVE